MNLSVLLKGLVDGAIASEHDHKVRGLSLDSREVKEGFVFIAINGTVQHGLLYVQQAIKNGAFAVIYDVDGSDGFTLDELGIYWIGVNDLGDMLGRIADRFYQSPTTKLDVIGITGTNGKTTCSQFLLEILPRCGVIGTLGWGERGEMQETANTTPDALAIHRMFADFVCLNVQTVAMEVSSHGLQQGRVNAVDFKGALFINLSRDHLDYHGSMAEYRQAKLLLFNQAKLQFVVVNADDENSSLFLAAAPRKAEQWSFSVAGKISHLSNHIVACDIDSSLNGINFCVQWKNEKSWIQTRVVGDFNVENLLAVLTVLLALGYSLSEGAKLVSQVGSVKGRMECFGGGDQPFVFVDYAHTPDALEKLLVCVKKETQGKLLLVFGCGGNRDKGKRAQMAQVAEKISDYIVLTNDNPRFERPEQIIEEMINGFENNNYDVIQNREKAIQNVIEKANKGDCVVIVGKGHEEYQDIKGVKHPFSDQDIVVCALQKWKLVL
jgi:UDP-N-acetylmuramoyl-L-alanyl-D-glutamate--2,6-diaminopimelate ligase